VKPVEREVLERWVSRRDELKRLHATVDGAILCEEVLADFEELLSARDQETVTLTEAAELTGYSRDHLGRLIRSGRIRNVGRKHRPLLLVRDLPARPRNIADAKGTVYDPNTDARSLRVRR
jgi:excisionase family DNA binding protein